MRAILSVSDKTGLVEFARRLSKLGVEIFSTGGTKKSLTEASVTVHSVSDLTHFPEILDGRVKTLHPAVYGGILARRGMDSHKAQLKDNGIEFIDLVVVNLYPFRETVQKPDVTLEDALENIDIGGPSMIRAAAKNFPDVLVIVDPGDYTKVFDQLVSGNVDKEFRKKLAQKAFQHVASYDTAIAQYLRSGRDDFAEELTIALKKKYDLRYGENPHQRAAFYGQVLAGRGDTGISSAKQLWGKELSYNNILDSDAAWSAVSDFKSPTVAVIKHTNPCGLASHRRLVEAYKRAFEGDTVAAYGGIVAFNRKVDVTTAGEIEKIFYEVIIAPDYDNDALEILKKKKDLRILAMGRDGISNKTGSIEVVARHVSGGFLLQTPDLLPDSSLNLRTVTDRAPTEKEIRDMKFAWKAVKHIKSNAIVLVKNNMIVGMGAGQPSRVVSVGIALDKAGERSKGSVLGSDAFFPFPDGVERAASGGVTAIIQPGGSVRDKQAIEAANKNNIAMVFTGVRHFKH